MWSSTSVDGLMSTQVKHSVLQSHYRWCTLHINSWFSLLTITSGPVCFQNERLEDDTSFCRLFVFKLCGPSNMHCRLKRNIYFLIQMLYYLKSDRPVRRLVPSRLCDSVCIRSRVALNVYFGELFPDMLKAWRYLRWRRSNISIWLRHLWAEVMTEHPAGTAQVSFTVTQENSGVLWTSSSSGSEGFKL